MPLPVSVPPDAAFVPLAGQPLLVIVVRALLEALADQNSIAVAACQGLVAGIREHLAAADLSGVGIVSVEGSASRVQCLAAGLEHLSAGVRHVLVHDIRQPLIPADVRDRVIAHLTGGDPVVLPTLPVTDSVKAVDDDGTVAATLDRSTLRVVQYPRGFAVDLLASLLAGADATGFDEAAAAIRARLPITMVDGDADAFVADLPRDAQFVDAVIGSRPQ